MIVLVLIFFLLISVMLILYNTNNIYNIIFSVFIISGIGYLTKYRY